MNLKYQNFNPTPYESHWLVYQKIKEGSRVLDVGCATGYFARELQKKHCTVWGIDNHQEALSQAKKYCKAVHAIDLDTAKKLPFEKSFFDYVLLLDVIEHLRYPHILLSVLGTYLKPNGKIILSIPNVAFISIRLALLRGKFQYTNMGIMDDTHVRFYTRKSIFELLIKNGYEIEQCDVASGFSQITLIGKYLNYIPKYWQYQMTKLLPTLLGYQFIVVCRLI